MRSVNTADTTKRAFSAAPYIGIQRFARCKANAYAHNLAYRIPTTSRLATKYARQLKGRNCRRQVRLARPQDFCSCLLICRALKAAASSRTNKFFCFAANRNANKGTANNSRRIRKKRAEGVFAQEDFRRGYFLRRKIFRLQVCVGLSISRYTLTKRPQVI